MEMVSNAARFAVKTIVLNVLVFILVVPVLLITIVLIRSFPLFSMLSTAIFSGKTTSSSRHYGG